MSRRADGGADRRDRLRSLPALDAAIETLGWRLVRDDFTGRRVGRIVEVEAYVGEADLASHARFGRTARNEVMYGPAGRAYVYLVYGMHDCLNIVTGPVGAPEALLVRAVEPIEGAEVMRASRARRAADRRRRPVLDASTSGTGSRPVDRTPDSRLAAGPGLVCAAFDIDRTLTGQDLLDPAASIRLEPPPADEGRPTVISGPRVGIGYAGAPWTDAPWRFAIAGSGSVSRPPVAGSPGAVTTAESRAGRPTR